jgi:hypothetical protein
MESNVRVLFGGAFKPPHIGHFVIAEELLKISNDVNILISPLHRDVISANQSLMIWNIFNEHLNNKLNIKISEGSPIKECYNLVKENKEDPWMVITGKNETKRYDSLKKDCDNVMIFNFPQVGNFNSTSMRNLIKEGKYEDLSIFIPDNIDKQKYISILK